MPIILLKNGEKWEIDGFANDGMIFRKMHAQPTKAAVPEIMFTAIFLPAVVAIAHVSSQQAKRPNMLGLILKKSFWPAE